EMESVRVGRSASSVTSPLRHPPNGIGAWLSARGGLRRCGEMDSHVAFAERRQARWRAALPLTPDHCTHIRRCGSPEAIQQDSPFSRFLYRCFFFSTIRCGMAGSKAKDVHFEHLLPPGCVAPD